MRFRNMIRLILLLLFTVLGMNAEDRSKGRSRGIKMSKIYAVYFPQFHPDPLNNRLWGHGFTDWDNVKAAPKYNRLGQQIPRPTELGYYNLLDTEVRRKQGLLAREYGIEGFIYFHYNFYNPGEGYTLSAPLEKMLLDGQPDLPFALNWVQESWSVTWQGNGDRSKGKYKEGQMLIEQQYPLGNDTRVVDHYNYLKRFFHHNNYILINGVPLFFVYYNWFREERVLNIVNKLKELAIADGFPSPGLHVPLFQYLPHHFLFRDPWNKYLSKRLNHFKNETSFVFYPNPMKGLTEQMEMPDSCMRGQKDHVKLPSYTGAVVTFDNTPRRNTSSALIWNRHFLGTSKKAVAKSLELDIVQLLLYNLCCQKEKVKSLGGDFILLNAWNEWGEGNALEPSDVYNRTLLESVRNAKRIALDIRCDWARFRTYNDTLYSTVW